MAPYPALLDPKLLSSLQLRYINCSVMYDISTQYVLYLIIVMLEFCMAYNYNVGFVEYDVHD